jgi:crotonobetainyl-CoA:carnitine CoA-transferase CaiB-like acyl-CoA transferase
MGHHAANYQASGDLPQREGSGTRQIVPYRGYRTADGFLVVAAGNDNLFARFCDALEHAEWKQDQRFQSNPDRVKNQSELYRMIEGAMVARTNADWIGRLEAAGVPCAPAQTIDEVLDHPQTKALGIVQRSPDNSMALVGIPLSLDRQRPAFRQTPPKLGEHTDEVFDALGNAGQGVPAMDPERP